MQLFGLDLSFWDGAQLLGLLSFLIGLYAFSQKSDHKLKVSLGCLFICQTLHFYFLGVPTAAAANFLSFIRTIASVWLNKPYMGWLFIGLNIVWGGFLFTSPLGVLPIIAACLGTYGLFFLSGIKLRLAFMTGAICWIINNIIVGSIGGVLLETMVLVTNLITIVRLRRK